MPTTRIYRIKEQVRLEFLQSFVGAADASAAAMVEFVCTHFTTLRLRHQALGHFSLQARILMIGMFKACGWFHMPDAINQVLFGEQEGSRWATAGSVFRQIGLAIEFTIPTALENATGFKLSAAIV